MKARIDQILEYHGFLFVNCQTLKETDTKGRIPLRFYDLSFEQNGNLQSKMHL
jgi:translation initiation factor 2 beta subunit (eIF-2beta)/eIF-5